MDVLVVQLPRGRTANVWFDPTTHAVATNHAGLMVTLFRAGVKDWEGRRLYPSDGRAFLSTVYDDLFLRGYAVHWLHAVGEPGPTPNVPE